MRGKVLLVALALGAPVVAGALAPAGAQGYPYGGSPYGGPPPDGRRPLPRGGVGYNCEAVQGGITGPAPFSCPLPGPRRLGARCFCGQPLSAFSGAQPPLAGQVVP